MTLRARLLLPIAAVSALFIGYLFAHWMPEHQAERETEIRASAQRHLATVAESFVPNLLGRQYDAIYESLDAIRARNRDWIVVELTLPDGTVLYPLDPLPGALVESEERVVLHQPIAAHDLELGRLSVLVDEREPLAEAARRHSRLVLASILSVGAFLALLWLLLERTVRRPVAALAHASKRMAAGQFDAPLVRGGTVEFDALVDSFQSMRSAIRGYQAELQAKNDSLKSLFEAVAQSPIAILIADAQGRVEYANPRFYVLTGQAVEETLGAACDVIAGESLTEAQREEVRRAMEEREIWRGEIRRVRKGGPPFDASVRLSPVRGEEGEIAHWLVILEDVTQQRALEQQLIQAQKMEALGTLAGGIAHDFNNVLSPIIGYTELARAHAADLPELAEDLAQVSEAAFRARDLVRQILTFSRKAEKKKVPLDVAAVARDALKLLRASIPATIEIRQRLEAEGRVVADPTQVHQVVMNLCTNAFHAMERSGGVLAVTVEELDLAAGEALEGERLAPGRYVVLSVGDTGVGMSRETVARIFDPYFTTKEKGKGTGLGLAVVDGIVRDHDGRIAVYSEPGVGTTFRVYLPAMGGPRDAAAPAPTPPPRAAATGHERVMVVDDEEAIRSIVGRSLREAGYRVELFGSPADALVALERAPAAWDLLLTDMTMPGMNGKELAKRAMELRPDLPVAMCCGYSSLINADEARRMGIRAYLEKPLVMRDLLQRVREVLDGAASTAA